jgi:outer membrane scaffolding protein for murein synthesis (MipA/OmpV family)
MKTKFASLMVLVAIFLTSFAMPSFAKKAASDDMTKVSGYTKKDGTVVKGYERKKKSDDASDMQQVKGYTKKDGTKVAGYSRKKSSK